jgi:hypothetical protein
MNRIAKCLVQVVQTVQTPEILIREGCFAHV